jgi:hypothetical protein
MNTEGCRLGRNRRTDSDSLHRASNLQVRQKAPGVCPKEKALDTEADFKRLLANQPSSEKDEIAVLARVGFVNYSASSLRWGLMRTGTGITY